MKFQRIHLIVLDSVGIGEAPDADQFGDRGADTLGNIALNYNLKLPNLTQLGLGNIADLKGIPVIEQPQGFWGKLQEQSAGKDTMTGHWEIMGLRIDTPFRVFPDGFPEELIQRIEEFAHRPVIGNKPASGTEIIEELGPEQIEAGALIVYTSADSVLQIAAHEDIIPLEELYKICEFAREITLDDPYMIGRIIARPYIGDPGNFERTSHRHDYALSPFENTTLDFLAEAGYDVISVGKIEDIFNGQGITEGHRTQDNMDGVDKLLQVMKKPFQGLSFTNLVDFDSKYGHRRDVEGYAKALEEFDGRLPEILNNVKEGDLLIITADHGNDPTAPGTDHTREYVPLLVFNPLVDNPQPLQVCCFSDIASTIAENFGVKESAHGKSFLSQITSKKEAE